MVITSPIFFTSSPKQLLRPPLLQGKQPHGIDMKAVVNTLEMMNEYNNCAGNVKTRKNIEN